MSQFHYGVKPCPGELRELFKELDLRDLRHLGDSSRLPQIKSIFCSITNVTITNTMETETLPDTLTTRQRIIDAYMEQLREHGTPPLAIYPLCKSLGIGEKDFFSVFPNLESVEAAFWQEKISHIITAVESGEEWDGFTAKQRALTFFFAWFEHSLEIRSVILLRFGGLGAFKNPVWLRGFNATFRDFAKCTVNHGLATAEIADRGKLTALYPDAILTAFRQLIDFNLTDSSRGFERTDAFIEKSVHLAFELIRSQAFDSAFDLARFLAPGFRR